MRIRKNASKILGADSSMFYFSTQPNTTNTSSIESSSQSIVCELNCSPWDVIDFSSGPISWYIDDTEDKEKDLDILKSGSEGQGNSSHFLTSAVIEANPDMKMEKDKGLEEMKSKMEQKVNNTKNRRKKGKELQNSCASAVISMNNYKKSEGTKQKRKEVFKDHQKSRRKMVAVDNGNEYFYYTFFGPGYGKSKRGNNSIGQPIKKDTKILKSCNGQIGEKVRSMNARKSTINANEYNDSGTREYINVKHKEGKKKKNRMEMLAGHEFYYHAGYGFESGERKGGSEDNHNTNAASKDDDKKLKLDVACSDQ